MHPLEGHVHVRAENGTHEFHAGQLLVLASSDEHDEGEQNALGRAFGRWCYQLITLSHRLSTPMKAYRTRGLCLGKAFADREAHEVGAGRDAEFFHHALLVAVNRLDATAEFPSDLHARKSLADETQHRHFARRK